uniref:Cation channel sperm associated auxiliary subunit gamma n=1 Tax=Vombatus ursinus TaxID=29139 RepID=A0A4X2M1G7_VOMUR
MVSLLLLLLLLLLLPAPVQLWAQLEDTCQWQVVLNKYQTLGEGNERFFNQEPVSDVDKYFEELVDSPIDHEETYWGFPYFLKINFTCPGENSEAFVRGGHLKGLIPIVLVTFYAPVNFRRWKAERLQIEMKGAPFRRHGEGPPQEACVMNWYTPMPMKNGTVVMEVEISSNQVGELIGDTRYMININGFLKKDKDKLIFTLGSEVTAMTHRHFINAPSRPVWATVDQAPVLILGGIPEEKMILISDSSFRDISLVELSINSCWLGSLHCPQEHFTATIYDTISTESVLFIRQNQLVYYFTGNYFNGPVSFHGESNWVQVLHSHCIKKLCPVEFHSNGSEYILALAGGDQEGFFHFGIITGSPLQLPFSEKGPPCWLHWVVYDMKENTFLLLMDGVETLGEGRGMLPGEIHCSSAGSLADNDMDFVMLLGMEAYTDYPLVPKGLFYNPFTHLLLIWGNAILQSYDNKNYIYMARFPKESSIKYMVGSYRGQVIFVTENEEIWFIVEGSFKVHRLYPSDGWQTFFTLSQMQASSLYSTNETSVSIFYDRMGPQQLVYLVNKKGEGKLVKRPLPVNQILVYQLLGLTYPATLSYNNPCPFELMQLKDLPNPQRYTRVERYRAMPPFVSSDAGFHTEVSLAIYQGLVYHLLSLHAKYNKPYADPVHDPTWRWWKDKKQHQAFYFYKASNFESMYGVHIEMDGYEKLYKLNSQNRLPEYIYLDKGTIYTAGPPLSPSFPLADNFLGQKRHLRLAVIMADPMCVSATVKEQALVNRNAMLFQVRWAKRTVGDWEQWLNLVFLSYPQLFPLPLSLPFSHFLGQGNDMIPIFIGCPPGKRLAFDVTLTLQQNKETNKRYFDCVYPDPEMPCFLFSDPFFPFFLIQDMVTGESGSFNGSYVLKVIGGGASKYNIVDYSEADIYRYNSPKDDTDSLIWTVKDNWMDSHSFSILRYNSSGIEWLCLENSPCHDIIPKHIFSPDFYFKIMVSNRDVDTSTYCDYQLTFLLHVHGLPLSPRRALFFLGVSLSFSCPSPSLAFISFYIFWCFFWPGLKKWWSHFKWKVNDIIMAGEGGPRAS